MNFMSFSLRYAKSMSKSERPAFRPRGPSELQMLNTLCELRQDLLKFSTRMAREYGDIVSFRLGLKRIFILSHPEHIRYVLIVNPSNYCKGLGLNEARPLFGNGLLTSEGKIWHKNRRLLQPAFEKERLQQYSEVMTESALSMVKQWRMFANANSWVDVTQEVPLVTLEIVGKALLGFDLHNDAPQVVKDLQTVSSWTMGRVKTLIPFLHRLPNRDTDCALKRLELLVDQIWQHHTSLKSHASDNLLSPLVQEFGPNPNARSRIQIRDEIITFLLVGYETTSNLICWACDLIARHSSISNLLEIELDQVLQGRSPRVVDLPLLKEMHMVLEESLRLYPSVWMLPRRSVATDYIAGCKIPAGSEVLLNLFSMHRHVQFWNDPEVFNPHRFASCGTQKAQAYLPFGSGERGCIGSRFGMMEATVILATILQAYHLETNRDIAIEPQAGLTLHSRGSIWIKLVTRSSRAFTQVAPESYSVPMPRIS